MSSTTLYNLILIVAFIALIYFMMIRPQRKRDKQMQEMRDSLRVGDEIVSIGGIYGKIISVKKDTVVITTVTANNKIELTKNAIGQVIAKKQPAVEEEEEVQEERKNAPSEKKKVMPKKLNAKKSAEKAEEAPVVEETPATEEAPVEEDAE